MPIPGLRGGDHLGITVPDLDEAEHFLVDVLGAMPVYALGPKHSDDDFMQRQLGVHPRTVIDEIRFYRLATGLNLEVFHYTPADAQHGPPRNSDFGGHHVALYVDDLDAAVTYLRGLNVEVMGDPVSSSQGAEGQRWVYFRAPWGMQFELVSYPHGKAYERTSGVLLWHPVRPAE